MKMSDWILGIYVWVIIIMLFVAWPVSIALILVALWNLSFIDRMLKRLERRDQRRKILALQAEMEKYRK